MRIARDGVVALVGRGADDAGPGRTLAFASQWSPLGAGAAPVQASPSEQTCRSARRIEQRAGFGSHVPASCIGRARCKRQRRPARIRPLRSTVVAGPSAPVPGQALPSEQDVPPASPDWEQVRFEDARARRHGTVGRTCRRRRRRHALGPTAVRVQQWSPRRRR